MKVLIIDDEIDICYLLSGLLANRNLETNYVNSIADAVLAMKDYKPQIIFLDNCLPDGKGVDFIEYIKKNLPVAKLVMITAYDTICDRNNAFSKGVDYFIPKPFSRDKIYDVLDEIIR